VDGIRLVAIAEPAAVAGSSGSAEPVVGDRSPVAVRAGTGLRTGSAASRRPPAGSASAPEVLGRVVASRLDPGGPAVRWGIGAGDDDAAATAHARIALRRGRDQVAWLAFATGDGWRDALLADLGLALAALLDDLTPRQAEIACLILVDGARQAAVAGALGVSRATVSVTVARGRLPAIAGALRAIEALLIGPPAPGAGRDGGAAVDGSVRAARQR
jgi:hypothetical protein